MVTSSPVRIAAVARQQPRDARCPPPAHEQFRDSPHWISKARHYLRLAEEHICRCV
jgi:hypothetical protein